MPPKRRSQSRVIGLDAAWGSRNPDGLCFIEEKRLLRTVLSPVNETAALIADFSPDHIAIDAPIIVPNATGSRPVDRLVTKHFLRRYKIACYPGNQQNCARILDLVRDLRAHGYRPSLRPGPQTLSEVYPHLTIVRLFNLSERLRYKHGAVSEKRQVFATLQSHLRQYLAEHQFTLTAPIQDLLHQPWKKGIEDQTDAILCALTAHLHLAGKTEHLGDEQSGFIVFPSA